MSKGDKQRPTDHKRFSANYDAINWGKNKQKKTQRTKRIKVFPS